jgi:DNA-binding transcriptional regulator YdaS (Cro superfamily)
MNLKTYLKDKDRKAFAKKIGRSPNYLNNLCQDPGQCGKKTACRIVEASGGVVTLEEMLMPQNEQ